MAPHPRIAFLTGAGFSIPAGMPSTKSITRKVTSKKVISDTYYDRVHPVAIDTLDGYPKKDQWPIIFVEYIEILKNIARSNNIHKCYKKVNIFSKRHFVNYEDLYYLLTQT